MLHPPAIYHHYNKKFPVTQDSRLIPYNFVMAITICAVSVSDVPLSILHFWI